VKITLHIGTEKTGSTSIQRALAADRAALAEGGILYPQLFGSDNHMELAVAAMAPKAGDELQLVELKRQDCDHATYCERLKAQIEQERAGGAFDRIVLSNEHCHSRLGDSEAVARLIALFDADPADCNVIVYLRRQDRLAVSLHSTRLKLGGKGDLFPPASEIYRPYYFDFQQVIATYDALIPAGNIDVRLYENPRLAGGDVVADFYEAAGLGVTPSVTPRANPSLSNAQSLFLARFNDMFPLIVDGRINEARGPIFQAIRNVGLGERFRPSRADALAFYEPFRPGNAAIRERFLPALDRPTLFDENFDDYPEAADTASLDEETLFEFVAAIWRYHRARQ